MAWWGWIALASVIGNKLWLYTQPTPSPTQEIARGLYMLIDGLLTLFLAWMLWWSAWR